MIFTHVRSIVDGAELLAANGQTRLALKTLRELSFYDFGLLSLSMPDPAFPALSALLPRQPSREVQVQWVGDHGFDLFRKTADFCSRLENYARSHGGFQLTGSRIMDYGCGFGRITRMMPYYTDADDIYGIDPWERSIELCRQDGVLGNLRISSYLPETLPTDGAPIDFTIAFSVFTHTSRRATLSALAAIRATTRLGGLLVLTVRPVEFWNETFHEKRPNFDRAALFDTYRQHGFAHLGNGFSIVDGDDVYGDGAINPDWFAANAKGWRLAGYDRGMDLMQTVLIFKAT